MLVCDFCRNEKTATTSHSCTPDKKIIAGRLGAAICHDCVTTCLEIIQKPPTETTSKDVK